MDSNSPQDRDRDPSHKRRRKSSISATRSGNAASPPARTELGHMRSDDITGSTSFVGSGSGIYFVRTVRSALARNISGDSEAIDTEMVPGEDDRIQARRESSSKSLWQAEEVKFTSPGQGQASISVAFEDLVRWSRSYFNLWHPPFPFLHAPSILGLFDKLSSHGLSQLTITEAIIVRSVLSISVADRRQMPPDNQRSPVPSSLIFNTIDDAISCLSHILMQSATISGLQATLSVQLFLISMLRLNSASRFGGLTVRIAFHLGIHRCPARYEQFSAAEADIRRRLFWSIYSLERFLAQSLGLPIGLKDDDIDVCFPYDEIHHGDHRNGSDPGQFPDQRLFLLPMFLARSSKIKGLILELRHISVNNRIADLDEVAHIDAEISKWWNEVQDFIDPAFAEEENLDQPGSVNARSILKPSHRLMLIVQKHESVILLNRPVITSGHNTYAIAAAMQKCIGASKAIIAKVYQYLEDFRREDGSLDDPLFWPGFTWCVWMSGLIVLYAASDGCYSVEMAQREASRCVNILENIALRGVFWPGACAAAIKDLQQALNKKAGRNSSNEQPSSSTARWQDTPRLNIGATAMRQSLYPELSHDEVRWPPSASAAQPNLRNNPTRTLSGLQSHATTKTKDSESHIRPEMSEASQIQHSLSQQNEASFPHIWSGGHGQFYPLDDHFNNFNNFDDIFQLMEVPYHLSEHTYEASGPANY